MIAREACEEFPIIYNEVSMVDYNLWISLGRDGWRHLCVKFLYSGNNVSNIKTIIKVDLRKKLCVSKSLL